ncbi:MAG: phosphotriesterase [Halobacteriales archaeon]
MRDIQTVTGPVSPDELGVTLPHEHLLIDLSTYVDEERYGKTVRARRKLKEDVSLDNLWWMQYGRQWDWRCRDRWRLDDIETAIAEANRFRNHGGETIVDVTPMSPSVGRDPEGVREIAYETGLNVILGTGQYIAPTHPPEMDEWSARELADQIVAEIETGIGSTTVQAGIIGEIGATEGFLENDNERKSFRAAAMTQAETGLPITIHPPVFTQEGHDVLDVIEDAGGNVDNVILGHLDASLRLDGASEYYHSLADRGVYLEFDLFGRSGYVAEQDLSFPLDEDRVHELRRLADVGYGDQLLASMDICHKVHLTQYGGTGYDYLLRDIVPLLERRGFDDAEIQGLMIDNPRAALTPT